VSGALTTEARQQAWMRLAAVKEQFAARGWFPATSGNLSLKVQEDPLVFLVTASGKDKTESGPDDFLLVDGDGQPVEATANRPSAETRVHTALYRAFPEVGAVFHVHTVANNVISELYFSRGRVRIGPQELIKGLGIWDEDAVIEVPIVENFADISRLAEAVARVANPRVPGVLIRNHGIYAWGESPLAAKRHLEAFEFLFQYCLALLQCRAALVGV